MIINGRYFIDDPESGLYEVSKEEYENYASWMKKMWEYFKPKINPSIKGKIMVFGTGGDFKTDAYIDTFYNPGNSEDFKTWVDLPPGEKENYFEPSKPKDL